MPDLEQELRTLGASLAVPDSPDVTASVRSRLSGPPARVHQPRWRVLVASVVAALAITTLVASPQARAAVAELFRFAGVDVHWGGSSPHSPADTPGAPLPRQQSTTIEDARQQAAFEVGVPARLGKPDEVVVADGARVVSLIYGSGPDAIRLDEFDGRLDPVFSKQVTVEAEAVTVAGQPALWLSGPHEVSYVGRDSAVLEETARLSGNTLIW